MRHRAAVVTINPSSNSKSMWDRMSDSPDLQPHDEHDVDKLHYVTVIKNVRMRKGKWQRFPAEQEQRMRDQRLIR